MVDNKLITEGAIALGVAAFIYFLPQIREKSAYYVSKVQSKRAIPAGYADEDKEPIGGGDQATNRHWLNNPELFQAERTKGAEEGSWSGYLEDTPGKYRSHFQQAWTRSQAGEFLFEPDRPVQREYQQLKERDRAHEKELEKQEKDKAKQRKPFPVQEWYEKLFSGVGALLFSEPQGNPDLQADTGTGGSQAVTTNPVDRDPGAFYVEGLSGPGLQTRAIVQSNTFMNEQAVEIEDRWMAEPGFEQDDKTRVGFYAPSYNHYGDRPTMVDRGKADTETIEENY